MQKPEFPAFRAADASPRQDPKKGQVTIPTRLRTQAGIADGDLVEVTFLGGKMVLRPKGVIDRAKVPAAGGEYTRGQRRIIDAGIDQGLEDFKQGRAHGQFASARGASAYIERMAENGSAKSKPRVR
jgi:AbrB family looped-hinge helix DNA binding protein